MLYLIFFTNNMKMYVSLLNSPVCKYCFCIGSFFLPLSQLVLNGFCIFPLWTGESIEIHVWGCRVKRSAVQLQSLQEKLSLCDPVRSSYDMRSHCNCSKDENLIPMCRIITLGLVCILNFPTEQDKEGILNPEHEQLFLSPLWGK